MKNKSKNNFLAVNILSFKLWWKISPNIIIVGIFSTFLEAVKPLIPIYIVGQLVNELSYTKNLNNIKMWTVLLVSSIFLLGLINALLNRLNLRELYLTNHYLSKLYSDKFLDMDFELIDDTEVQGLYSHIKQSDNWSGLGLRTSLNSLKSIGHGIFLILGSSLLSFRVFFVKVGRDSGLGILNSGWFNGLFVLTILALIMLIPLLQSKRSSHMATIADDSKFANRLFGFFGFEMFSNLKRAGDIRMYRQEIVALDKFEEGNSFGVDGSISKVSRGPAGIYGSMAKGVVSLIMGLIFFYVGIKSWAGAFGLGEVTQYIGGLLSLSNGIIILIDNLAKMNINGPFLENTFKFLDLENIKYQGSLTVEKRRDRKYEIEVRNVSFKYPRTDQWALKNLSMKFNIGERLAIVGTNGSGKTTLIKLLCRLYDPTEGEILLNGIDIRKYNYEEYMSIYSVVFQDFKLLALPMGENIAVSKDYDVDRVNKVIEDAGLDMDKGNFNNGLDTYLYRNIAKDGVEVSGGEAQKIAIARALYDDAPFIILDEPTASLDPIAESEIYEQFNSIIKDRTAIFISHRLSSCKFADRILVFDEGTIIEEGSHADLISDKNTRYYELWESQAQYYR